MIGIAIGNTIGKRVSHYWTPLKPLGGETPNFWIKEGSRNGFVLTDSVNPANNASILTPTYRKVNSGYILGNKARTCEHFFDGSSHTLYYKFKAVATPTQGYVWDLGASSSGTKRGISIYLYSNGNLMMTSSDGTTGNEQAILANAIDLLGNAGWCEHFIEVDFALKQLRSTIYGSDGVRIGNVYTKNISTFTFNTNDNSAAFRWYPTWATVYNFKKFSALKTIEQCRNQDYVTDVEFYVPDLISKIDVSGNGNHFTAGAIQTLQDRVYDTENSYLLNKGYVRYIGDAANSVMDVYYPNSVNGTEVSVSTPTGCTKDKLHDGSLTNHNMADSLIEFAGATFDRSDTTIWSASARVVNNYQYGYYISASPKRWHPIEINRLKNQYWANTGYDGLIFPRMDGGSLMSTGRNFLQEIICYTTNKTSESDLNKVLKYCGDELLKRSNTVNFSSTQGASLANFDFHYIAESGAEIYLSEGEGTIVKLVADGTEKTITTNYTVGSKTYEVRLVGELLKFLKWRTYETTLNFDITEFEKTPNIYYIGTGYPRTLIGRITNLLKLKSIWTGYPTIPGVGFTGNLNSLSLLEEFENQGVAPNNLYCENITGRFENIPKMQSWCSYTRVFGDISGLKDLKYFSWGHPEGEGLLVWGDITDHTALYMFSIPADMNITGNCLQMADMESFEPPVTFTKPTSLAHMPKLSVFTAPGWELTEANVNQYLADIWANREVVRVHYKNTVGEAGGSGYREITIRGNSISSPPTGQGLTDKTNLQATKSPAVPGTGVVWTITTR